MNKKLATKEQILKLRNDDEYLTDFVVSFIEDRLPKSLFDEDPIEFFKLYQMVKEEILTLTCFIIHDTDELTVEEVEETRNNLFDRMVRVANAKLEE